VLIRSGLVYDLREVQGSPWLLRLVERLQRLGPWFVVSTPPLLTIHPQGDRFVFSETADRMALAGVRTGPPQPLNGESPACYQSTFSPDGRWLAYSCFSLRFQTYCPTLRAASGPPGARPPAPQQHCAQRGSMISGPYWQPDSRSFVALTRRGQGAYLDPVHRVCLVRVEVPSGRSRALWCQDLSRGRDDRRQLLFRPAPEGRTGVLLEGEGMARGGRVSVRWLRLSDGQPLAAWQGVSTSVFQAPFAVPDPRGRLLVRAADDHSLLRVDLATGRAVKYLRGRHVSALLGPWGDQVVVLEQLPGNRYRLLGVDLRRARSVATPALEPLVGPRPGTHGA
jgi:hypothetical protein